MESLLLRDSAAWCASTKLVAWLRFPEHPSSQSVVPSRGGPQCCHPVSGTGVEMPEIVHSMEAARAKSADNALLLLRSPLLAAAGHVRP